MSEAEGAPPGAQKQKTERRLDSRCIAQGLLVVSLACQIFWVGREAWDPPPDFNDDLLHAALARACALAWRGWLLVAGWSLLVGIALYDRATRRSRTGPAERRASSLRGGA